MKPSIAYGVSVRKGLFRANRIKYAADGKSKVTPISPWGTKDAANKVVVTHKAKDRLEYLRGEIKAERISFGEIAELQSLASYIEPSDTLLLEWAGVQETLANALDAVHTALSGYVEDCIASDPEAIKQLNRNWEIVRKAALRS